MDGLIAYGMLKWGETFKPIVKNLFCRGVFESTKCIVLVTFHIVRNNDEIKWIYQLPCGIRLID